MRQLKPYWNYLISSFVILANLSFLLLFIFSADTTNTFPLLRRMNFFFNSDSLNLAQFYKDVFIDNVDVTKYDTSTCTLVFPIMLTYFPIMFIFRSAVLALLVNGLFEFFLFLILFFWLQKTLRSTISPLYYLVSGLSVLLFLIYLYNYNLNTYLLSCIFLPYHTGALLNTLLSLILVLKYYKTKRLKYLWLFSLVIIVSYFSDNIYIVYFIAPAFLLSVILLISSRRRRRMNIITLAILILSGAVGYFLLSFMNKLGYLNLSGGRLFDKTHIIPGFKLMLGQYLDMISTGGFNRVIIIYFLLNILVLFSLALRIIIKNLLRRQDDEMLESIYIIFSSIFLISVFLAPALAGKYSGYESIRYNIFIFIVALANSGIILRRILINQKYEKLILYSICGLLLLTTVYYTIIAAVHINPPVLTLNYKPEVVKALEYVNNEYKLKNGVGTYWDAKLASVLMGKSKRLYQVNQTLFPDYMVNNPNVYYHVNRKDSSTPVFNYIVDNDDDIDMAVINNLFNHKQKAIYCANRIVIFQVPDFIFTGNSEHYIKLLNP
jgi:hypothetical protein